MSVPQSVTRYSKRRAEAETSSARLHAASSPIPGAGVVRFVACETVGVERDGPHDGGWWCAQNKHLSGELAVSCGHC